MKIRRSSTAAVMLAALGLFQGAGFGQEPIRARVWLNPELSWEADILGRFGRDKIRIRKTGEQGEVNLPAADVLRIDYALKVDRYAVLDLYLREKFAETRNLLREALRPCLQYADIPSNLWPLYQFYFKALYWTGEHEVLDDLTGRFLTNPASAAIREEVALFRVLALLAEEKPDQAESLLETISKPAADKPKSALYHYAAARLHQARGRRLEVLEQAATVIAFHAKDFEWMPAALFLSAQAYAEAGNTNVARQIVNEIGTAYPGTRWERQAESLLTALDRAAAPPP